MADWRSFLGILCSLGLLDGRAECSPTGSGYLACQIPNSESFTHLNLQYIIFYDTVTWDEAAAICPTYKGSLANLDNMQKAVALADALSESNRRMNDVWLGARKLNGAWMWLASSNILPHQPGPDEFPPWVYYPDRPGRECLTMDRKSHTDPLFVDVGCTQLKSFVCERSKDIDHDEPREMRSVRHGNSVFSLFHGRLDWFNAVAHCRKLGRRLAVINSRKHIYLLSQAMTKSRPDFETAWIGGKFSYGSWRWAPTGEVIPDMTDVKTLYPPWRKKNGTRRVNGCILLDRHVCDEAMFFDSNCLRTRDFICEQYSTDASNECQDGLRFRFKNLTFEIIPTDLTWEEASEACIQKGGDLAHIQDLDTLEFIVDLMSEAPGDPLSHVWIGGEIVNGSWKWSGTDLTIAPPGSGLEFPPWCDAQLHHDMPCLNLDRTDHSHPSFYGLECNNTQPSICRVECQDPHNNQHGMWTCSPPFGKDIRTCVMECYVGYRMFGNDYFTCTVEGWADYLGHNIAPECVTPEEYDFLLVDKIEQQLRSENIGSILFVVEDSKNVPEESLVATLAVMSSIVQAVPLSESLRGGVTFYGDRVVQFLPLNVVDSCLMVRDLPAAMKQRVGGTADLELALTGVRQQINKYNHGNRSLIVLFAASDAQSDVATPVFEDLQHDGHVFYVVTLNDPSSTLKPTSSIFKMASIGPDESFNVFNYESSTQLEELSTTIAKKRNPLLDCRPVWNVRSDKKRPINPTSATIEAIPTTTTKTTTDDKTSTASSSNTLTIEDLVEPQVKSTSQTKHSTKKIIKLEA